MRTLLLDNYDSYTYNLFQLIAEVNGVEPVVLHNDAPECAELDLDAFDNVVISPGPGHPGRRRDFGVCARILEQARIPVLGVCLGHQGIAAAEGGVVRQAPEPRHGYLSKVLHLGEDLFRGLPQGFTAVRYHSLSVHSPLPSTLRRTAWAEDGVPMGIRHLDRPIWGVQFHPESVLTEHGHQLLANFRDLTMERRPAGRAAAVAPPAPSAPTVRLPRPRPPAEQARRYRLHTRALPGPVDPEAAFAAWFSGSPRAFWLDSSRTDGGQARFSFLGDDSGPLAEFVRYDVRAGAVEVERAGHPTQVVAGSVFDYLKRELAARHVEAPQLPFDFTCGYVGYFGYETKSDCGAANRHQAESPDACWLFADRMIAVDHQEDVGYALCLAEDTPAGQAEATRWLDRIAGELATLPPVADIPAGTPPTLDPTAAEPWLVRDRQWYLNAIAACQQALRAGESYEICLTNAAWLPAPFETADYYRRLRRHNPAPYSAYLRFGDVDVACSSPERFLRITRDRTVESRPIKGTAPRGRTPQEDERLRAALAESHKTRAENLMIVDLLRNDLGRVCEVGTVAVPQLMQTETYQTLHQLVSTVQGHLRPDADAIDCVRACFPGGSMTGAPKLRTCEIIDELEPAARGVYSGTIGYLSCSGTADLNIVIRSAVIVDGRMHLGAGGAIVLDSDPEEEYAEMLLKLAAQMQAYHAYTGAPPRPLVDAGRHQRTAR
jgi:para-aminobenzoate synthetase